MENIKLLLNEKKRGAFIYEENKMQIGEMEIGIHGNNIAVYHTEIIPEAEGKGIAKLLLQKLVNYAREHNMKVAPLCPYVYAQFQRYPDLYNDVWEHS